MNGIKVEALKTSRVLSLASTYCIAVTALLFYRGVREAFDLVKFVALVPAGAFLIGAAAPNVGRVARKSTGTKIAGVFLFFAALSTAFSMRPNLSFFGQDQRYTGLILLLISVAIFFHLVSGEISIHSVTRSIAASALLNALYVLIQYFDKDPFEWYRASFGGLVTGMLGNPNTTAAHLAIAAPFFLRIVSLNCRAFFRLGAIMGYLVVTAGIGMTGSFLGTLHVVGSLLILIFGFRNLQSDSSKSLLTCAALLAAGLWFSVSVPSKTGVLLVCAFLAATTMLETRLTNQRSQLLLKFGAIGGIVALFYIRETLVDGVSSGFLERGDFYRAAWKIFLERPIVGSGLETYGLVFPEFRPTSHAANLEFSISNSAHSLYLGMLSNGGVFVFASFVVLFVYAALRILRSCFRTHENGEEFAVAAMLMVFMAVALVVVEHVALFVCGFALAGAALSREGALRVSKGGKKRFELLGVRHLSLGLVVSVVAVLAVSRPLYVSAQRSLRAEEVIITTGDFREGELLLKEAISLTPWDGVLQLQLGDSQIAQGLRDDGLRNLEEGIEELNFSPLFARNLVDLAYQQQDFSLVLNVVEGTLQSSPGARETWLFLREMTERIQVIGQNSGDVEMTDRALRLISIIDAEAARLGWS